MGKGKGKKEKKDGGERKEEEGPDLEAEFEILLTSKNLELAQNLAKAERLNAQLLEIRKEHQVPCLLATH